MWLFSHLLPLESESIIMTTENITFRPRIDLFALFISRVFFMQKYDFSPEDANFVNSIVYIISAVASPLFGYVIDKTGRNVFWILISVVSTILAHCFLAFTYINPYICTVRV